MTLAGRVSPVGEHKVREIYRGNSGDMCGGVCYMTRGHGQTTNQEYGLKRRTDIKNPQLSAHKICTNLGVGTTTTDRHKGTPPYM